MFILLYMDSHFLTSTALYIIDWLWDNVNLKLSWLINTIKNLFAWMLPQDQIREFPLYSSILSARGPATLIILFLIVLVYGSQCSKRIKANKKKIFHSNVCITNFQENAGECRATKVPSKPKHESIFLRIVLWLSDSTFKFTWHIVKWASIQKLKPEGLISNYLTHLIY